MCSMTHYHKLVAHPWSLHLSASKSSEMSLRAFSVSATTCCTAVTCGWKGRGLTGLVTSLERNVGKYLSLRGMNGAMFVEYQLVVPRVAWLQSRES